MRPRVIMIGPPPEGRGGMSSVVAAYREIGLFDRCSITHVSPVADGPISSKLAAAARALVQFGGMLCRNEVQLVHIHLASGMSFWRKAIFASLAYSFHKPVILHLHSGNFVRFSAERSAVGKRVIIEVFRRAQRVIILSDSWLDNLPQILSAERCVVIDNPVVPPLPCLERQTERRLVRFVFLGRLEAAKGAYELLEAFAKVAHAYPAVHLVMGGTGDLARCQQLVADLSISQKVSFPGWVLGQEKVRLLRDSDVFVLPSHIEGMPISMLEAMSCALPMVVCPVGSVPEAVKDGDEAIFVPPGDVNCLSDAMLQLATDAKMRKSMGQRGLEKFSYRFDAHIVGERIEALYKEVLNELD